MSASCGCGCGSGAAVGARAASGNRPGLGRIAYRAGTYASFFGAMLARLSSADFPELAALKARAPDDPAIALLDAWAVVGDVLSFYDERIANENYLRTASERRSVLELARLTGYRLRPGVSASVYLAYEMEQKSRPAIIPVGTRAQSIPGPGEQMQTFETAEALAARAEWNALRPRLSRPLVRAPQSIVADGLYLQGLATQLKPNDALLIDFSDQNGPQPYRVDSVVLDEAAGRTKVMVRDWRGQSGQSGLKAVASAAANSGVAGSNALAGGKQEERLAAIVSQLEVPPVLQPSNALRLARNVKQAYTGGADVFPQLLQTFNPVLGTTLYGALGNIAAARKTPVKVYALRTKAALFGHNAPSQPQFSDEDGDTTVTGFVAPTIQNTWSDLIGANTDEGLPAIALDRVLDPVKPGSDSYLLIDRPAVSGSVIFQQVPAPGKPVAAGAKSRASAKSALAAGAAANGNSVLPAKLSLHRVAEVRTATMATWVGAASEVTQVTLDSQAALPLDGNWLADIKGEVGQALNDTGLLRGTRAYLQSEPLAVAEEAVDDDICDADRSMHEIELDALYDGLKPGRWLILAGERRDVPGTSQVTAAELVMLAAVRHGVQRLADEQGGLVDLPGDKIHTFITLAKPLAHCYRRATVTLYANVVRATHGETRRETLGGGDAARTFQQFPLRQPPLTFVAAATPEGVASTLEIRVNEVRWPEAPSLSELGPAERGYISRRDNEEKTSIIFGDGKHGARTPTGAENVKAVYRNGIGPGGNVAAGQITLATDRPLGVKGVNNPLRGAGGAAADSLDQARANAPLTVMALDRLVSLQDYADFARIFAGIGKAGAMLLHDGQRRYVQVTIAGIDDLPIDASSDLYQNLLAALRRYGDPQLPLQLRLREALVLALNAKVSLLPQYSWETVAPRLRAALLAAYGFAQRELGQAVLTSAIVSVIQNVAGVAYAQVQARLFNQEQLVQGLAPQQEAGAQGGAATTGEVVLRRLPDSSLPSGVKRPAGSSPLPLDKGGAAGRIIQAYQADPCAHTRIALDATQIAYLTPEVPDTLILELLP